MRSIRKKVVRLVLIELSTTVLFFLLVLTTNPYKLPVGVLVLPFILLFVLMYAGVKLFFIKTETEQNGKKRRLQASIFASGVLLLALLQSIRQLSRGDVIIIVILIVSLLFYIRRLDL